MNIWVIGVKKVFISGLSASNQTPRRYICFFLNLNSKILMITFPFINTWLQFIIYQEHWPNGDIFPFISSSIRNKNYMYIKLTELHPRLESKKFDVFVQVFLQQYVFDKFPHDKYHLCFLHWKIVVLKSLWYFQKQQDLKFNKIITIMKTYLYRDISEFLLNLSLRKMISFFSQLDLIKSSP